MAIAPPLKMSKYFIICFAFLIVVNTAMGQVKADTTSKAAKQAGSKDTLKGNREDTLEHKEPRVKKEKVYHPDSTHSPHKAVIRSLIIPGWGQVYNHRWWKVPIIYGVLGSLGYGIVFNTQNYNLFLV